MPEPPALAALPALPLAGALPVVGGGVSERCDAARNRQAILAAAQALVASSGPATVTMDQVAAAAGVGKGTLFRRFGDRAGLMRALLSDRESAFQEQLIRGAPPLGPGAPAAQRLLAYGPAYLVEIQAYAELLAAAESRGGPGHRMQSSPYQFHRTHVMLLLRQAAPSLDAEYHADVLLGPLAADVVLHQREAMGMSIDRIADGWRTLAERLLSAR